VPHEPGTKNSGDEAFDVLLPEGLSVGGSHSPEKGARILDLERVPDPAHRVLAGQVRDGSKDGRQDMHMLVAVQVSRSNACIDDPGQLGIQFPENRGPGVRETQETLDEGAGTGGKKPSGIRQSGKAARLGYGPETRQDQVRPDAQPGKRPSQPGGVLEGGTARHEAGTANRAPGEASLHGSVHSAGKPEVVGIDDESPFPRVGT